MSNWITALSPPNDFGRSQVETNDLGTIWNQLQVMPYGAAYNDALLPITNGGRKTALVKIPNVQRAITNCRAGVKSFTVSTITSTFFSQTGTQRIVIPRNQFTRIEKIQLEWNLSITNATYPTAITVLAQTFAWFSLVTITLSGGNATLNSITPYSYISWILTCVDQGSLYAKLKEYNCATTDTGFFVNPDAGYLPGVVAPLYYDLDMTFISKQFGLWMEDASYDLIINLTPNNPIVNVYTPGPNGGTGVALTSSVITLNNVRPLIIAPELSDQDRTIEARDAQRNQATVYLDEFQIMKTVTLTPGQMTKIPVNSLGGRLPWIDVFIYPTGTSLVQGSNGTNGILTNTVNLGDAALIDFQDSGGVSKITDSGGLIGKYMITRQNSEEGENTLLFDLPSVYRIRFKPDNLAQAYDGVQTGFFWLNDINAYNVALTPALATSQVDTITKSTGAYAMNAGYISFKLPWCGDESDPVLFSASVPTLNAALNNLPYFLKYSITAVFSATFATASATITVTYTSPRTNGLGRRSIQVLGNGLTTSIGADAPTTAMTTQGVCGIPSSGGSYDVYIIGQFFCGASIIDGELSKTKLGCPNELAREFAEVMTEVRTVDPTGALKKLRGRKRG
jgi:hypothetical protein